MPISMCVHVTDVFIYVRSYVLLNSLSEEVGKMLKENVN